MHNKPVIAQKSPCRVQVEEGKKYWFCTCGLSHKQPFCDGTHRSTSCLKPIPFEPSQSGTVLLCGCKNTKKAPFCDGTHNSL